MNEPLFISTPDRRDIAHESGRLAYRAGIPHHECPYMDSYSVQWSLGWIQAQREHSEARKVIVHD